MNTPNNRRKRESREKIEKVFVEFIQNKEINEISVTDICKKTNLNRSTFYANYLDIYDLADKINLVKIRDERDFFRCQLEQMKQNENSFICDSKMQMNEINRLDEENRKLSAENDDLKVQLSKLDKMIYGKIRPNFKC